MSDKKYQQVYNGLLEFVNNSEAGVKLPSIRSLMRENSVSQATVDRAIDMLRRKGLITSHAGKGLFVADGAYAGKRPRDVCILATSYPSSFFVHVSKELHGAVQRAGYISRIENFDTEKGFSYLLKKLRADAFLVMPDPGYLTAVEMQVAEKMNEPVLFLDTVPVNFGVSGVSSDNSYGGGLAAEHLLGFGHKKLVVVVAEAPNPNSDMRAKSFCRYARLMGAEKVDVLYCNSLPGDNPAHNAYKAVYEVFGNSSKAYSGIFVTTNIASSGVLKALHDLSIPVPDAVSVVGYGYRPDIEYLVPSLTSIDQDIGGWCEAVVSMLDKCFSVESADTPEHMYVEPLLSVRSSTAPLSSKESGNVAG